MRDITFYILSKQASENFKTDLRPHQERVRDKLKKNSLLVFHGLGSGKTLTSIAGADQEGGNIETITPASLRGNFTKEVDKHTRKGIKNLNVESFETRIARNIKMPKNTFLIVDEAHSLRNSGTKRRKYIQDNQSNIGKAMLLTGTPIYNKPSDISFLMNLVKGKKVLEENETLFDQKYVEKIVDKPGIIGRILGAKPNVSKKVLKNKKELEEIFKGHVDYHKDTTGFPDKVEKSVVVEMGGQQNKVYNFLEGNIPMRLRYQIKNGLPPNKQDSANLNAFLSGVRQVSNSPHSFIDGMTPLDGAKNSPKLVAAAKSLEEGLRNDKNFKSLTYTNYMEAGAVPFSNLLSSKGITNEIFHGGLNKKEKEKIVNDFNSGKLKHIIGTSSASEGLDLKGTKKVQILEPHFNNAKVDQVIGRGIRYKSHHHLPEDERKVEVERFFSKPKKTSLLDVATGKSGLFKWMTDKVVSSKQDQGTDKYMQGLSDKKQSIINEMQDLLMLASK